MSAQLDSYGLLPEDVKSAVAGFQGIPEDSANAVLHIAQTGKVDIATVTPLIAAGLAATGVGAPAAAVVSIALPLVQSLGDALGLFQHSPEPKYDYYWVATSHPDQYMGFNGKIPYGPTDPTWKKWPDFVAKNLQGHNVVVPIPYYEYIRSDLKAISDYPKGKFASFPKEAVDFIKAYLGAWAANAERGINGHKWADEGALLQAVTTAWQRSHAADKHYTFQLGDSSSNNFISYILGGNIDKNRRPPLTINVGATIAQPVKKSLPKPSAAATSALGSLAAAKAKAHSFPVNPHESKNGIVIAGGLLLAAIAGFLLLKGKR